ncbi:hypothetical protein [Cupriavidus taiwanensis]|uniref:hypothetical protein n=1 Tax=Cupriavidus taiwanensis TaxID=164546 RepID=UPI0011C0250A|nr:hypothetical protein [Cupriavidus taiwanensis]
MLDELQRWRDSMRLVIDCGAFTAHRKGESISLDAYCEFIEQAPVHPWRYFTLDVVGDPGRTRANYDRMVERGLKPMAIFTRGESLDVLEHYYRTADVIGTGGMTTTAGWLGFINGLTKAAAGRRLHWLGFANMRYMKYYRPYMADTAAWRSGDRYGNLRVYMGHGDMRVIKRTKFQSLRDDALMARIRHYGFEPADLLKAGNWRGLGGENLCNRICAASAVAFSLDVQRNLGTLLFNAVATPNHLRQLMEAWHYRYTSTRSTRS